MPTGIIEQPLYDLVSLETSAWTTPFSWVNRTNFIVGSVNYEEGGRLGPPGASQVDVGTLTATFKDLASPPLVGDLVRIRRAGTSEYAFTGYVQDVSQQVIFDRTVSFSTPVILTSILCLDWVGYVSQFQLLGIGGKEADGDNSPDDGFHDLTDRVRAFNRFIDPTGATLLVNNLSGIGGTKINDTDKIGTLAEHLDLAAISTGANWNATHVLPTNTTTGRDGLIEIYRATSSGSSGKTFTDLTGSAGELHYVELDSESSSANVANSIILNNRHRYRSRDAEVVIAGGVDSQNFVEIDGQQRAGFMLEIPWNETDASSITTYGLRQAEIETCVAVATAKLVATQQNLIGNPSVEYNPDGYTTNTNGRIRRAKPADDANPFDPPAGLGEWSMRHVTRTADAAPLIRFQGINEDKITVFAGDDYNFGLYAYRGIPNRADVRVRAQIQWLDEKDDVISTVFGSQVSVPGSTWVQASTGRVTAPAGTVACQVAAAFNRSGGGNFSVGDRCWSDGFSLYHYDPIPTVPNPLPPYFDGDTPNTTSHVHIWTGSPGASPSYRETNTIDNRAVEILAQYSTTSNRVTRIRWNAQEDLTSVAALRVGRSVIIKSFGTTATYRIIGISANITSTRYMIDYYVVKI